MCWLITIGSGFTDSSLQNDDLKRNRWSTGLDNVIKHDSQRGTRVLANKTPLSATLDCWADNNNRRLLQIRWQGNLSFQSYAKVNPPFSVGVLVYFAVERLAAAKTRTLSNLQQTPTRVSFIEFPYGFAFLFSSLRMLFAHCSLQIRRLGYCQPVSLYLGLGDRAQSKARANRVNPSISTIRINIASTAPITSGAMASFSRGCLGLTFTHSERLIVSPVRRYALLISMLRLPAFWDLCGIRHFISSQAPPPNPLAGLVLCPSTGFMEPNFYVCERWSIGK